MKVFTNLFLIISLSSCGSTSIGLLDSEHCATEGRDLVPTAVNSNSSKSVFYNYSSGSNVYGKSDSRNLMCSKTDNKYETCLSQRLKKSGLIVSSYNQGTKRRRFLTGLGYVLWIAPGVAGAFYNNHYNDSVMTEVKHLRNEAFEYCEKYKPNHSTL